MTTPIDPRACGLCRDCKRPMLSQAIYWEATDLRERGYVRRMGHDLCATDYLRARKAGTLPDPAPRKWREKYPRGKKPPCINAVPVRTVYAIVCQKCGEVAEATGRSAAAKAVEAHTNSHLSPIEGGAA